jgi:GT2 family glycosyltransferase
MNPPRVLFMMLNHNGLRNLGNFFLGCIDAMLSVNYDNAGFVVIDNASQDGSTEALDSRYNGLLRVVRLRKNYGVAGGFELGVRNLVRELPDYLVMMNNDYRIRNQDFLREIIKAMEGERAIALAQGINLGSSGVVQSAGQFVTTMGGVPRFSGSRLDEVPEAKSYITHPQGSCFIIRPRIVMKLTNAVFDVGYFAYFEVAELGLRLWRIGLRSAAYPVVVGEHHSASTFRRMIPIRQYLRLRNELINYRRHFIGRLRIMGLPLYLSLVSSIIYRPLQGDRGRLLTRGVLDGLVRRLEFTGGLAYPLVLVLGPEVVTQAFPGGIRKWAFRDVSDKIQYRVRELTLGLGDLRRSRYPYLVFLD